MNDHDLLIAISERVNLLPEIKTCIDRLETQQSTQGAQLAVHADRWENLKWWKLGLALGGTAGTGGSVLALIKVLGGS